MINYLDTRGLMQTVLPFSETIVKGIADGGGLFVPDSLPTLPLESITRLA